jgi:hypothetical protein
MDLRSHPTNALFLKLKCMIQLAIWKEFGKNSFTCMLVYFLKDNQFKNLIVDSMLRLHDTLSYTLLFYFLIIFLES